ncbi:MAG TPA: response regulator transcription factor [Actinomycetota bacterium]|nr:response regulator transcription factor [Actinomycetota bacterium]
MTTVFVLEDHQLVREAIADYLSSHGMEIVGQAATAGEGLTGITTTQPDVALIDVGLPDGNGMEVCREVASRHPDVRCLMITGLTDDSLVAEAVLAGAYGFVTKTIALDDLLGAVEKVAEGVPMVDPSAAYSLIENLRSRPSDEGDEAELTRQESRTLDLIAEGLTNREIAERLQLAEQTVKNYVSNILTKLGFERRTQAALYAARKRDLN